MTRSPAPPLYHVFGVCLRIVATRGSPEALPYSRPLFQMALGAALLLGVVNRVLIPGVTATHAAINAAGEVGVLLFGLHVVLTAKEMRDRFHKIATAMLCISAMGGTLLLLLGRLPESPIVSALIAATYVAQLSGALTSLRRGLDTTWWAAGLYLFAYLWLTMLFFNVSGALVHAEAAAGGAPPDGGT